MPATVTPIRSKSVAPSKAKKPVKKTKVTKKSLPSWWTRMSDDQRAAYIKKRPRSKYAQYVQLSRKKRTGSKPSNDNGPKTGVKVKSSEAVADARTAMTEHPKDRKIVRDALAQIAENPKPIMDAVDQKLNVKTLQDNVEPEELKKHEERINTAVKNKDVKTWHKLLKKTLVYAGLGLAGALLVGTGALPYAIIVGNLVKESRWAFQHYSDMIDSGTNTLEAMCSSGSKLIGRMATNPAVLMSAVALKYGKNKSDTGDEADVKDSSQAYFDKQKKRSNDAKDSSNEEPDDKESVPAG